MSSAAHTRLGAALAQGVATVRRGGLARQLVGGAVGNVALNIATALSNFVIAIVLARSLGPKGYGIYAIATTWALLLTVPAVLGLPPLVIRKVSEYLVAEAWGPLRGLVRRANQAVLATALATCAAAGAIGWVAYRSNPQLQHAFLLALLLVPLTGLHSVRQATLMGLGRTVLGRVPAAVVSPGAFVLAVGAVAVFTSRISASTAVVLNAATTGLALALSAYLLVRFLPKGARDVPHAFESRIWLQSAWPLVILSAIMTFTSQAGVILIGIFKTSAEAGVYSVSARAATMISFLLIALRYPLGPTIARLYAERDLPRLQQVVGRSAQGAFFLTLPFALGLIFFAGPFLRIFFGAEFGGGATILRILAIGELVNVVTGLAGMILLMTGHERRAMWGSAIGAVIGLVLTVALIPLWGARGAAAGTAAGVIVSNLLLTLYAWRSVRIYSPAIRPRWLGL